MFSCFFFKSLKVEKIPESKPDQKQIRTEFQKFLRENGAIALFSIQNPFNFLSVSGLVLIFSSLIAQGPIGGWWSGVSVLILCIGKLSLAIAMKFSEIIASSSLKKIAAT